MTDGVIKSTGNSRYLKSVANFMSLYPTYEDFVAALVAGTLPIDLNGINPNGWSTQGTPLNKANLLADATASLFGLSSAAVVNDALSKIGTFQNSIPAPQYNAGVETGSVYPTGYSSSADWGYNKSISISLQNVHCGGILFCSKYSNTGSGKTLLETLIFVVGTYVAGISFSLTSSGFQEQYFAASASFDTSSKRLTITPTEANMVMGKYNYIEFTKK